MPSLLRSLNNICICSEASFFISVIFMSIISHSMPAAVLKMIVFAWKCKDRVILLLPEQQSWVQMELLSGLDYILCVHLSSLDYSVFLLTDVCMMTLALIYYCTLCNFRTCRLLFCNKSGKWRGHLEVGLQELWNGGFQWGVNLAKARWWRMGKTWWNFWEIGSCMGCWSEVGVALMNGSCTSICCSCEKGAWGESGGSEKQGKRGERGGCEHG